MKNRQPLILISNDDGVNAKGINQLIEMLKPLGDIVVMAPDAPRSGASMAITSRAPVHFRKVRKEEGLVVYSCTGTPVDCIKLALDTIVDRTPDLIVGGINHGDNSAVNVHYSGTMAIVLEGCLKGIPSVGFSISDMSKDADFSPCSSYVHHIASKVLSEKLPIGTCLNVNFPLGDNYKGVRVCRQNRGQWVNEWEEIERGNGDKHYWLTGIYENGEPEDDTNDSWALANGFVSVTPVTIDMTAYSVMDTIKSWNL